MWQHLLACSVSPRGPSGCSSRVLPGLAGTEGEMNLRGCPGRLPARLRESTALSPKQSLSPFPTTCTHPRPLPAHTMYTRAHATPPSRRGARRGSGGQLGRWNVRSCRCQTCLLQRASGRIPDSSEPRSPHLECKQQERDVRPLPPGAGGAPSGWRKDRDLCVLGV